LIQCESRDAISTETRFHWEGFI